jgi:cyclic beta-1,2-glucan synthetase
LKCKPQVTAENGVVLMFQNTQFQLLIEQAEYTSAPELQQKEWKDLLERRAEQHARALKWVPVNTQSGHLQARIETLGDVLQGVLARLDRHREQQNDLTEDQRWLFDNQDLLQSTQQELRAATKDLGAAPQCRLRDDSVVPRVVAIAQDYLQLNDYLFTDETFLAYVNSFQCVMVLESRELGEFVPALRLGILERVIPESEAALIGSVEAGCLASCIRSLWAVKQAPWKDLLESLIVFDRLLREDPAGAYSKMDFESRSIYRDTVAKFAKHSDCSEVEVAQKVLESARNAAKEPEGDPRLRARKAHVGYYLIGEGSGQLLSDLHARLPLSDRLRRFLRRRPDEFYFIGIELLTILPAAFIILAPMSGVIEFWKWIMAIMVLALPCSQTAVEVMNYVVTSLLTPQILPKLDFSEGIPDEFLTMVVVPTLLLNEKQVHKLVEDLEVRYLGNSDRNLHFALLTDLTDSVHAPDEDSALVELCAELIRELNTKYAGSDGGTFAMFHRHRVYNKREGVWMGWERKRGKLLDFNQLIVGKYDSFPVKVGDLSLLPRVKFVLTLDSDSELPRGAAQRLIGTLAHPLNRAIVDKKNNIVTAGYSILQPRVGISVHSASRSRLADIYSGQTGLDIYTRATSNVYQDLYGEAIFTGKGLYEVKVLHQVLDGRFPRNALLSHDLIEGAYGRVGLVSDVEVIDDYPSHYSAFNRRKHRWLRGDWQIVRWLLPRVPDERGNLADNPTSFVSRWKILDNLRRSLVEPAFFALFLLGWTILPMTPRYWTSVTVAIMFLPPFIQFLAAAISAIFAGRLSGVIEAGGSLLKSLFSMVLNLTFLAYQTLISLDAILRTLYRSIVTQKRLLEWETAAEAELEIRRTPVDTLFHWTPVLAITIGAALFWRNRPGFYAAVPILLLWTCSKLVSNWLNSPPHKLKPKPSSRDQKFLREVMLYTWRYFAEFSNQDHHWLIPDNVEEMPEKIAARISPTNLGLLLNARQIACEFGYLTLPEFVELTQRTLTTISQLQHHRGHLLNWYDTHTTSTVPPYFVSTVDNGNLLASLISLKHGCLARLKQPLIGSEAFHGYMDCARILAELGALPRKSIKLCESQSRGPDWMAQMLEVSQSLPQIISCKDSTKQHTVDWFARELRRRVEQSESTLRKYAPWLMPEFAPLRERFFSNAAAGIELRHLPKFMDDIEAKLTMAVDLGQIESSNIEHLLVLMQAVRPAVLELIKKLEQLADQVESYIAAMDFGFLMDCRRKLLSIGYDVEARKLHAACYDLLASEARTASFLAIAKGDVPQECWFGLNRSHTSHKGAPVLMSWTGTIFEYLMPDLWISSYPNTLLHSSKQTAVAAQQNFAAKHRVPWGVSESSFIETSGAYGYYAFGVPELAVKKPEDTKLVIAPYASVLAIEYDPEASLKNLRRMAKMGWLGAFGFYEAIDYSNSGSRKKYQVVKQWMAHHQGMSLLALANYLKGGMVRRWFHSDRRVQATNLLLHERPAKRVITAPRRRSKVSAAPTRRAR